MLKVGITGGIGSGKTTICQIFEMLDIPVYYADLKAKELMTKNEKLVQNISSIFGPKAYTKDHQLNSPFLADKVFKNSAMLAQLNELVHPEVAKDFEEWSTGFENPPYCLKEAAILFENDSYKKLDRTILVVAPKETRIERVMKRDNVTRDQVLMRINNQRDQVINIPLSNYIINNDGNRTLIHQVMSIHKILKLENERRKVLS